MSKIGQCFEGIRDGGLRAKGDQEDRALVPIDISLETAEVKPPSDLRVFGLYSLRLSANACSGRGVQVVPGAEVLSSSRGGRVYLHLPRS